MSEREMEARRRTAAILDEVLAERVRQDARWGVQSHPDGTGGPHRVVAANEARQQYELAAADGALTYLHIMEEEVREAFAETDAPTLRAELIQVAAVAVQWVEKLDREAGRASGCVELCDFEPCRKAGRCEG